MDTFWIRTVSQLGIYITFAAYLLWTLRQGRQAWVPFVGTVLYALVFEHFNMLRYAHTRDGYHYHPRSWLFLWGDVPLYIPLAWAFIVASSRALTDEIVTARWRKPFADALFALLIDLSLDIVAIRLGFWFWHGVGQNEGFFGVPADNFIGWLLVTFTFSGLSRWLWESGQTTIDAQGAKMAVQWLVIPIAAYVGYLVLEAGVHGLYLLFHANTLHTQLYVLAGLLAGFGVCTLSRDREPLRELAGKIASVSGTKHHVRLVTLHGPRQIFHIFGIIGLLCVPLTSRLPALWGVTLSVWAMEALFAWRAHAGNRRPL